MAEPLFGSIAPLWPTIPVQTYGYLPTPLAPAKVPFNTAPPTMQQPLFAGAEFGVGVTAPALLAAVAMRRGQPLGPTNDQEIEDFICDALDLLAGAADVEVRCEGGRATLTGTVPHKRLKRDAGEIAWTIPSVNDVQNNVSIAARRRTRAMREAEAPAAMPSRKQA